MPYASAVLADSPVHYYRLNEPSGTSAVDSGSGANNGTYVSCALNQGSFVQNDAAAASVAFNGSTSEVDCPTKFPCVGAFTVEGWIHGSAWGGGAFGNERMAAVGQFPDGGWGVGVNASGNPLMTFFSHADYADTNTVLATGKNYHLAVTYDGSSTIKFYINGALTNTLSVSAPTDPGSGYTTSYIGRATYTSVGSDPFNGYLAEVAIYTTVLSAARIRAHFNASGNVLTIGTPTLTNSFPVTIAKPSKPADDAGVSPGDVIFILVGADNSAGATQNGIGDSALTPPTGFTSDGHYTGSANNWLEWLMHRTADGTEGSTFTPTASLTGADGGAICVVLRGIDPTNPVVALSEFETLNTNSYVTDTVNCITRSRIVPMVAMAVNAASTSTLGWPGALDQHAGGAGSSSGNMTTYLGWGSSNFNGSTGLGSETIVCSTSQYAIYGQFALRLAQTPQVGVDVVQVYYSTQLTDAYPAPVHPGNTLVVGFQKFGQQGGSAAAPNITSVTDGSSANTWIHMTGAKTQQSPSTNYAMLTDFYYVESCAVFFGGPSQRPNIVTTEDVSTYCRMLLIELSPSVHDQAVGGHAHLVGSGTQQISAGTITPTRGDGVGVFLGNVDNDGSGAWGAMGWTESTIVIHSDGAGGGGTYNSMALLSHTPVADNFENLYHVAPIDFCASGETFIPTPSGGPVAITATAAAVAAATCKVTASAKLAPAAVAVALTTASARAAALLSPSAQAVAAATTTVTTSTVPFLIVSAQAIATAATTVTAKAALSPSAQAASAATGAVTTLTVPFFVATAQASGAAVALVTAKTPISASAQAMAAATGAVTTSTVPFLLATAQANGAAVAASTSASRLGLAAQANGAAVAAATAPPQLGPAAQATGAVSAILRAPAALVPVAGASTQASAVVATATFLSPHAAAMTHAGAIVVTVLSYAFVTSTSMTYALATTEST